MVFNALAKVTPSAATGIITLVRRAPRHRDRPALATHNQLRALAATVWASGKPSQPKGGAVGSPTTSGVRAQRRQRPLRGRPYGLAQ